MVRRWILGFVPVVHSRIGKHRQQISINTTIGLFRRLKKKITKTKVENETNYGTGVQADHSTRIKINEERTFSRKWL